MGDAMEEEPEERTGPTTGKEPTTHNYPQP
ncbi:hypothetical protein A2U01_0082285, partial [Trifolium medium]|nr:hypothetical protein [Trifolium medium]